MLQSRCSPAQFPPVMVGQVVVDLTCKAAAWGKPGLNLLWPAL